MYRCYYDHLKMLISSNLSPSPGGLVSFIGSPDSVLRLKFNLGYPIFFKNWLRFVSLFLNVRILLCSYLVNKNVGRTNWNWQIIIFHNYIYIYEIVGKLYVYYYYHLINIINLRKYQLPVASPLATTLNKTYLQSLIKCEIVIAKSELPRLLGSRNGCP